MLRTTSSPRESLHSSIITRPAPSTSLAPAYKRSCREGGCCISRPIKVRTSNTSSFLLLPFAPSLCVPLPFFYFDLSSLRLYFLFLSWTMTSTYHSSASGYVALSFTTAQFTYNRSRKMHLLNVRQYYLRA